MTPSAFWHICTVHAIGLAWNASEVEALSSFGTGLAKLLAYEALEAPIARPPSRSTLDTGLRVTARRRRNFLPLPGASVWEVQAWPEGLLPAGTVFVWCPVLQVGFLADEDLPAEEGVKVARRITRRVADLEGWRISELAELRQRAGAPSPRRSRGTEPRTAGPGRSRKKKKGRGGCE